MSRQLATYGHQRQGGALMVLIANCEQTFYELFDQRNFSPCNDIFRQAVKEKHRQLAREYHPDKYHGDDEAEKEFRSHIMQQINSAKDMLLDPELKSYYDDDLRRAYGATQTQKGTWHFVHWIGSKLKSAVRVAAKIGLGALLGAVTSGPVGALMGGACGATVGALAEHATETLAKKVAGKAVNCVAKRLEVRGQQKRALRALEERPRANASIHDFEALFQNLLARRRRGKFTYMGDLTDDECDILERTWDNHTQSRETIDKYQLYELLVAIGQPPQNRGHDLNLTFQEIDTNQDGVIDFDEFMQEICQRVMNY